MVNKKIKKTQMKAADVFRCMVENGFQIMSTDSLPGRSNVKRVPHLRVSRSFRHAMTDTCGPEIQAQLPAMHGKSVVLAGPNPQTKQTVRVYLQTGGVMTETALQALKERTGLNF